jgi:hypothetical protein
MRRRACRISRKQLLVLQCSIASHACVFLPVAWCARVRSTTCVRTHFFEFVVSVFETCFAEGIPRRPLLISHTPNTTHPHHPLDERTGGHTADCSPRRGAAKARGNGRQQRAFDLPLLNLPLCDVRCRILRVDLHTHTHTQHSHTSQHTSHTRFYSFDSLAHSITQVHLVHTHAHNLSGTLSSSSMARVPLFCVAMVLSSPAYLSTRLDRNAPTVQQVPLPLSAKGQIVLANGTRLVNATLKVHAQGGQGLPELGLVVCAGKNKGAGSGRPRNEVKQVILGTAAAHASVRAGDRIARVNNMDVSNLEVEEVVALLRKAAIDYKWT